MRHHEHINAHSQRCSGSRAMALAVPFVRSPPSHTGINAFLVDLMSLYKVLALAEIVVGIVSHLTLDISVVDGDWVTLVIVSAWHLVL